MNQRNQAETQLKFGEVKMRSRWNFSEGTLHSFEDLNAELAFSFHEWQMVDPTTRVKPLPEKALIVFQVEGHEDFNDWARKGAFECLREMDEGDKHEPVLVTCGLSAMEIESLGGNDGIKLQHVNISLPIYPSLLQLEPAG